MLLELIPQISCFIFFLALVGYLAKYCYNIGYYHYAYNPSSKHSIEALLNNCSLGIFLILMGIIFYVFSVNKDPNVIPEVVKQISISSDIAEKIIVFSYFLALSTKFIIYISFFSLVIGFLVAFGTARMIVIDCDDKELQQLKVREIYSESEDFFYYLTLDGNWGSVRKSSVKSIKEIKGDSRYDIWVKKDKRNRYVVGFVLIIYLICIFFNYY